MTKTLELNTEFKYVGINMTKVLREITSIMNKHVNKRNILSEK